MADQRQGFSYPVRGPFGMCLQDQLKATFDQNVAFSDTAWENAKQNCQYGCVLPPGIPQWPPGVTPLAAMPNYGSVKQMTDPQLINTLQVKPFQFDSPFVVKDEYKRFVPNDSPAVLRSLENGCMAKTVSVPHAVAQSATTASLGDSQSSAQNVLQANNMATTFFRSLVEAIRGMAYDSKNFQQLPGTTTGEKLNFMLTHDQNRVLVLVLGSLLALSVLVFIILMCVLGCCCNDRSSYGDSPM